jgi:hypothetical protein
MASRKLFVCGWPKCPVLGNDATAIGGCMTLAKCCDRSVADVTYEAPKCF